MDGVLVVDKPARMTSHDVVARVRRALGGGGRRGRIKVGHAGTLDPDATGVLVVCLGRATRLVPFLQASRKTYDACVRLGATTSTLDASGAVVEERDASGVDEARVCDALKSFVGEIEQVPPMVSAVKVAGERLYAKARRGEVVDRPARRVVIHDLVLEDFEPGPAAEVTFLVTCSAGTYVRTLAADLGERLGVGGHLVRLRRLGSGRFSLEDAVPLEEVEARAAEARLGDVLIGMAAAMSDYPALHVDPEQAESVAHGRPLPATGHDGPVAVLDSDDRLLAVAQDRAGLARPLVVLAPARAQDAPARAQDA